MQTASQATPSPFLHPPSPLPFPSPSACKKGAAPLRLWSRADISRNNCCSNVTAKMCKRSCRLVYRQSIDPHKINTIHRPSVSSPNIQENDPSSVRCFLRVGHITKPVQIKRTPAGFPLPFPENVCGGPRAFSLFEPLNQTQGDTLELPLNHFRETQHYYRLGLFRKYAFAVDYFTLAMCPAHCEYKA